MLGKNESEMLLRKHDGQRLDVVEIFGTIQGEGPFVGTPATFIRLAGCHLKCYFCDTDFTSTRQWMMLDTLIDQLAHVDNHPSLVVLTGGEPMRQNIVPLCEALADKFVHVQIETAGSFWPEGRFALILQQLIQYDHVSIVVSPKTSHVHDSVYNTAMAWKYIITHDGAVYDDGLPLQSTQDQTRRVRLARPPQDFPRSGIFLQPCDHHDPELNLLSRSRAIKICQAHGYRLSLQTHKIVGLP